MYGERIRELREERNLTQAQLAEALGVSQKNVSKYELELLGLNTEIIVKLCRFFAVSSDYFLGLSDY